MLIAVDAAGGDYAPYEVVKGAIKAAQEFKIKIALVGRKEILYVLAARHLGKTGMTIVDASEVIGFHDSPVEAVATKQDSSIVVGTNLVKEGIASAFVSAGSTGAVYYAALVGLGKVKGIDRPAIGIIISLNPTAPVLLVDAGANADCRPGHLVQFAQLGSTYIRELSGIKSPRVALLSNGEEESKGNRLVKETHQLLKTTKLNFVGNIEGHEIAKGTTDVIVTDGFTGNVVLKVIEGLGANWLYSLAQSKEVLSKAYRLSQQALHRDIDIDSYAKKLDYKEAGGACLLGVNGTIIIAHGRSKATAIKNAIGLAKRTVERSVSQKIKEESYEQAGLDK